MLPKEKALLLVHRIPYPPDKGDKIRSWRLFKFLAEQYDLSLGCFVDDEADWAHTEYLESLCAEAAFVRLDVTKGKILSARGFLTGEALTMPFYRSIEMSNFVKRERSKGLVVEVAFSSSMAPYIKEATAPRLVDMVDVDSAKWAEYASKKSFPMSAVYRREAKLLAREEGQISTWAEKTFLISDPEQKLAETLPGVEAANLDWWMNGVDTDYFDPAAAPSLDQPAPDLVFTGAMDYWANIDAVKWFVAEVWPALKTEKPELTFAIVGSKPAPEILKLGEQSGITVTGRVPDIRPWIKQAKLAIAPLRIARGVQNKVLEAMAMGQAIVASPEAATGINAARDGIEITIAEDADAMTKAILTQLAPENASLRAKIGTAARACTIKNYRWDAQLQRFAAHLPNQS